MITIDDLRRVELRIGEIVAAERMAGTERLLRLTVDVGTEPRVLVAGLGGPTAPRTCSV